MEFLAKRLGIKLDYNDNKYVEDQIRQLKSKLQKTKSQIEEILDNNRKLIEKILLLFNIILTYKTNYSRFPFDIYIDDGWSLEHIHAQNSEEIRKDRHKKELLEEQKKYFEKIDEDLAERIESYLDSEDYKDDSKFKELQDEIFKKYADEEDIIDDHSIGNLALLSVRDNPALSNNIFPIKRDKIIERDKKGRFIPIGTKNVFLKYFSKNIESILCWNQEDRKSYMEAIQRELEEFFGAEGDENEQ